MSNGTNERFVSAPPSVDARVDDLATYKPDPKVVTGTGGQGLKKRKSGKRASPERWARLRERRLGPCYVCSWLGLEQTLPSTLHHIVSKSLGGHDTEGNCVPLCGDGTRGHHGDVEAHRVEACRALAAYMQAFDDLAYSYAVMHLGEDGFLRRYKVRFDAA